MVAGADINHRSCRLLGKGIDEAVGVSSPSVAPAVVIGAESVADELVRFLDLDCYYYLFLLIASINF